MRELAGKAAFVTGGANGIGFAMGRAFAETGMKVMLADIETGALEAAVKSLHGAGPDVRGVLCDVADPASVDRAAGETIEAFGNVHVVCNNAGVDCFASFAMTSRISGRQATFAWYKLSISSG